MPTTNSDTSRTPMMASSPGGDIEKEIQIMVSETAKETEESITNLSESKDRAQMTANTALSLSLIVVLKELLDQGPKLNRYYYVSMSLVSICLIFQVTIGLLALVMYSLKSRTEKNKAPIPGMQLVGIRGNTDVTENLSMMPMGMDAVDSKDPSAHPENEATRLNMDDAATTSRFDSPDGEAGAPHGYTTSQLYESLQSEEEPSSGCCPCIRQPCKDEFGEDFSMADKAAVKIYEILCLEQMKALLEFTEISVSTKYGATDEPADTEDTSLENLINEKWNRLKVIGLQERLVGLKVRLIRKRKTLAKITTVQGVITYLMYVVFILNAFITGFGVA